ncbi:glutaredoxin [Escherichia phage vB_EcoM_VR26]|uniref:Glutaredoxin n=2 Tax=Gaprivervirus TaxID=1913654 RepID=A0A0A7HCM4_9CAUD|nr:glutaredoxin [Escherichia phage vB_EcoM_VR25]YP_009213909.1 glutaredoxin [Escherichia phage vB_EcoM_VR26]AIZ02418.1 glutaredoxin [Escherichia phage vB_EcoM_VR25]AIZ02709.1 glutaredoxin [Escherichia phage vB_EcoM_VR26]
MGQNSTKIEIYGIPEEVGRCPGCMHIRSLLGSLNLPYTFYSVLNKQGSEIAYDRPLIVSLAKRAGYPTLNIRYPVIFVNDEKMTNIPAFKTKLISLGYDQDLIED